MTRAWWLLAAALSACGAEPAVPAATPAGAGAGGSGEGATTSPTADATSAAPAPEATAAGSAAPAPPAAKKQEMTLAHESAPPGTEPLTEDEKAEVKKSCRGLVDAMEAAAKKKSFASRADREAFVDQFLASDTKVKGVDVPRCAKLILRDLQAYRARMVELEAQTTLGAIVVGLATALEKEPPQLCPSAGPVPADLNAVKNAPFSSTPADWQAPGWKCASWQGPPGPQRFQYELKTDARAKTFEIIARGFPVAGAPATELVTVGEVKEGRIQPTRQVWRRR